MNAMDATLKCFHRHSGEPDCLKDATWSYMGIGLSAYFCDEHAFPFREFIKRVRRVHWSEYLHPVR